MRGATIGKPPGKTEAEFRQDRYVCIQKHDSEQKFQDLCRGTRLHACEVAFVGPLSAKSGR